MNPDILKKIEKKLGQTVKTSSPCSGGSISDSYILKTENGENYFCKINTEFPNMFLQEKEGLLLIGQAIRVPKVLAIGENYILMEYIVPGQKSRDTFFNFGRALAKLHKCKNTEYGLGHDNHIGSTPQINKRSNDWIDFYLNYRLLYQLKLAEKNNLSTSDLNNAFIKLERKIQDIINPGTPSLIHGDLWSGNYLIDKEGGACLIDPAIYFANREAEFGMITLFGGFNEEFFKGYQEVYPLEKDWEYRNKIYQLYHLMNHLNLFGKSYYGQVMDAINYYL